MLDLDLMTIFNGFIRNYKNFGLNNECNSIDVIKQENKYFIALGKILGFSVTNKRNNNINNIEISWDDVDTSSVKMRIFREVDLERDLSAVYNLIKSIKERPKNGYIQILDISSPKRIDFLNKIILDSLEKEKNEFLIIYITREMIKDFKCYNAYLFENSEVTKHKIGISSYDSDGSLKANFYVK